MKLEHFAMNVADPTVMAGWYEEHLKLKTVRHFPKASDTHFLADSSGTILLEIYNNPADQVPPYAEMNPLLIHLAFVSTDPAADKENLLAAGASLVEEIFLEDGSHLVMMRDPWGLAIQLCKRGTPMI